MNNPYEVDIGTGIITKAPDIVSVRALGSCVALMLWDIHRKIGGVAHILLPDSTQSNGRHNGKPYQYADTAVKKLLDELIQEGASKPSIKAKAIGGAVMFPKTEARNGTSIGRQNINSIKAALEKERIKLIGEDTGGTKGRSAKFNFNSGDVVVRIVGGKTISV